MSKPSGKQDTSSKKAPAGGPAGPFAQRHLLGIDALSKDDVKALFRRARYYADINRDRAGPSDILKGLTLINLFFENSTRTLASFDLAAKRLGMTSLTVPVAASSLRKEEDIRDMLLTLDAMQVDAMVVRHTQEKLPARAAKWVKACVINAGDGTNEHPTQALLDAYTVKARLGGIEGLTLAIVGDIRRSRVAGSNIRLFQKLGADVRLLGPENFLPDDPPDGTETFTDMKTGLKGADVIMMLRVQKERMETADIPDKSEYFKTWGLTEKKRGWSGKNSLILHPGPMNRGMEISDELADNPDCSAVLQQVENGVAMRMAILDLMLHQRKRENQ